MMSAPSSNNNSNVRGGNNNDKSALPFQRSFFAVPPNASVLEGNFGGNFEGAAMESLTFYTFDDDQPLPAEVSAALSQPEAHFVEIEVGEGGRIEHITGSHGLYLEDSQLLQDDAGHGDLLVTGVKRVQQQQQQQPEQLLLLQQPLQHQQATGMEELRANIAALVEQEVSHFRSRLVHLANEYLSSIQQQQQQQPQQQRQQQYRPRVVHSINPTH